MSEADDPLDLLRRLAVDLLVVSSRLNAQRNGPSEPSGRFIDVVGRIEAHRTTRTTPDEQAQLDRLKAQMRESQQAIDDLARRFREFADRHRH